MRALLLVLAVLVTGCDSSGDDLLPVEGGLVAELPPRFDDLPAPPETTPPPVTVRTTGEYPCFNYELVVKTQRTSQGLTVAAEGARLPGEICLTAFGPAAATVDLPDSAGDGFEIVVTGPGLPRDAYVLVSRDGRYGLERATSD